ncbi:hypothetical protein TAMA11512_20940 [Selenomonas sp. TAMA-11512]|nr:hypothetical protein TAMA11512_20940 [Selenomonas sp. TAMA-11512]
MSKEVKPEVVAAITAAVQSVTGSKVIAVRIKRSEAWTMANRQQIC